MADSAVMRLEEMLPEVVSFEERGVFTKEELKNIMGMRRKYEYSIASRSASLQDYMRYIDHEIKLEIDRRERFEKLNIKKEGPRDFTIVQRVHFLFGRCLSKYSADIAVWKKCLEFCVNSGSSAAMARTLMRAIKRHPRVAEFRIMAADRELQLGGLVGSRKQLMLAVRAKTDNRCLIWEQLFKLECVALHRQVTKNTLLVAEKSEVPEETQRVVSAQTAVVVVRHGLRDLADLGKVEAFRAFCKEALESLEMSILGYPEPANMESLREIINS